MENKNYDGSDPEYEEKREKAWSCCMNSQRDSKGCQKNSINRLKWNLDSIP